MTLCMENMAKKKDFKPFGSLAKMTDQGKGWKGAANRSKMSVNGFPNWPRLYVLPIIGIIEQGCLI